MTDIASRFLGAGVKHVRLTQFSQYSSSMLSGVLRYTRILGVFPNGDIHLSGADTGSMCEKAVYVRRLVLTRQTILVELSHFPDTEEHRVVLETFLQQCRKLCVYASSTERLIYEFLCGRDFNATSAFILSTSETSFGRIVFRTDFGKNEYPVAVDVQEEQYAVLHVCAVFLNGTVRKAYHTLSGASERQSCDYQWSGCLLSGVFSAVEVFDVRFTCCDGKQVCLFAAKSGIFVNNLCGFYVIQGTEGVFFTHILVHTGSPSSLCVGVSKDGDLWELSCLSTAEPRAVKKGSFGRDDSYCAIRNLVYSGAFGTELREAFRYGDARIPSGSYRVVSAEFTTTQ